MHVVGIRLKNFARFRGEHEVAPLGPKAYAIVARSEDDEARSNYLGKSALLVALRYALYGVLSKAYDTLDDAISLGEEEMSVEVELSDGTYIARDRKRGKWAKLLCCTPDGVEYNQDAAQEVIVRYLGLDLDTYEACAEVAQKKADRFSVMKSSEITDVVNGWVGLDRLIEAEDQAAKGLAQLTRELAVVEQEHARLEWATEDEGKQRRDTRAKAATAFAEHSRTAEATVKAAAAHERWVEHLRRSRIAEDLGERRLDLLAEQKKLPVSPTNEQLALKATGLDQANLRERDLAADCRGLSAVAAGEFDGACPVLPNFVCPAKTTINGSRKTARTALDNKRAEHALALQDKNLKATAIERLNEESRERARVAREILQLDAELKGYAESLTYIDEHGCPPESAPAHVSADSGPLELAKQALVEWEQAAGLLSVRRTELEQRRARVAAFRVGVLALEQAQRRLSEGVVQRVERGANQRLAAAGIDLRVEFHWGRETNRLATRCGKCGAEFPASQKIKNCQVCSAIRGPKIEPKLHLRFSNRSGAVEDVTGVVISLAASRYIRERRGAEWGVIVLDEVFTSLDTALRRGLTGHLNQLVTDGFEQAFIVAHSADVLSSLPGRIEIVGKGDWSSVSVVA